MSSRSRTRATTIATVARPKVEEYGDALFVVMNTVELTPTDEIKVGEVGAFVGRNYVLTVRRRSDRGFQEVRARTEREPELLRHGPGYVLYALMDAVVDRYFPVLDAIEVELEAIEERLFTPGASPRENIESLYYVKQRLTVIKHATGPLLENAGRLFGGRVPPPCAGLGEYFRDVHDHLVRVNQSIDAARDTVGTGIQVALAMVATGQGEITRRLAAYAALVAVPTMIAGVYGMNFEHMPELKWTYGYPLVMGVIAAIDLVPLLSLPESRVALAALISLRDLYAPAPIFGAWNRSSSCSPGWPTSSSSGRC